MTARAAHPGWRAALVGGILLLLAGCSPETQTSSGIGGTGIQSDGGGIGGTGAEANGGGIGGTGIVGTITGFGSIVVNGLHVDVPPALPVNSVYGPSPSAELRIGQVVAIEAETRDGRLTARRIDLRYPVTGAVERIDRAAGEIVVLGQRVRLTDETRTASGAAGAGPIFDGLAVGDRVDVSGLRDGDLVDASWVRRRDAGGLASLFGPVAPAGPAGVAIGGRRLAFAGGGLPPGLQSGDMIQVVGDRGPDGLHVRRFRRLPAAPFGGRFRALSLEGFVVRGPAGRGWRLGRAAFEPGAAAIGLKPGARIVLSGNVGPDGQIVPRKLRVVSPRPPRRVDAPDRRSGRSATGKRSRATTGSTARSGGGTRTGSRAR